MSAGKSVADILAGAKDTLNHANALSDSVHKEAGTTPAPAVPAPKNEHSAAPYSIAHEANSLGKELRARQQMNAKGQEALK